MFLYHSRLLFVFALRVQPGTAPDVPPMVRGPTFSASDLARNATVPPAAAAAAAVVVPPAAAAAAVVPSAPAPSKFALNECGLGDWIKAFMEASSKPDFITKGSELISKVAGPEVSLRRTLPSF